MKGCVIALTKIIYDDWTASLIVSSGEHFSDEFQTFVILHQKLKVNNVKLALLSTYYITLFR